MFIPFRCEYCTHGEYLPEDDYWDAGCHADDDDKCKQMFVDKRRKGGGDCECRRYS